MSLEDSPNSFLKKYIASQDTKLTIRDQNGVFVFEGYGGTSKTQDSLILDGEFGKWEIKDLDMVSYELKESLGFDSGIEVNVQAYLNKLPDLPDASLTSGGIVPASGSFKFSPMSDSVLQYYTADASAFSYPQPVMLTFTLTPEQTLEVLQEAKTLLIENGWIKGAFVGETQKGAFVGETQDGVTHCTLGALGQVMMEKYDLQALAQAQHTEPAKILAEILNGDIATWNDDESTTFGDVMDLFDRAILETKEKIAEAPDDGS